MIRATLPSSIVLGAGGGGRSRGAGGVGGPDAASTTNSRSRPSSRTSTPPVGISAVISAAACEMASMIARRADESSA